MPTLSPEKIEKLLAPISDDAPTGVSIAYDSEYLELERAATVVPDQEVGKTVVAAVEPEWRAVRSAALDLLPRSKDLRVLVHLVTALLKTEGFTGFRDGVLLLKGTIEKYWKPLYPQLDPEDNDDPLERMNIVRVFASRDASGVIGTLVREVRLAPLTDSRLAGKFSLKDIASATNPAPATAEEGAPPKVEMALIEAAAKDSSLEFLQASAAAVAETSVAIREMEILIDGYVGAGRGIDFKDMIRALAEALTHLNKFLGLHGVASGASDADAGTDGSADADGGSATISNGGGGISKPAAAISGEIRSRDDVGKMLDKICGYYEKVEPSSPVPLLLKRARRLLDKDFWGMIMDLSPDAVTQIQTISGTPPPEPPA